MAAVNLWAVGKHVARAVLGDIGAGISPFPYALIFPQDEHERLLIDRLGEAGIEVERATELVAFEELAGRVHARLRGPDGATQTCEAAYLAGCDGAHSAVRQALAIGFPGGTYEHLFYVADVAARGPAMNGELHAALDTTDFLAIFPLKEDGRARLIGTVRADAEHHRENLSWNDVSSRVIEWMHIEVERVNWFSLLGDAAHIHSPVGGQGMNTGIGDAANLAWKLAAVLQSRADVSLLESYEPERIAFVRRLVATTDQAFTGVTSSGTIARRVRLDVVPLVVPMIFNFAATRRFMFRTVSQTGVNYRHSRLSEGRAGSVQGGDRLPWVEGLSNGADNYAPLTSLDWQVHVYGDAAGEIQILCTERALPLHVWPWSAECRRAGLRRDSVYLVRPDGYVALADPDSRTTRITDFLDAWKVTSKSRGERMPDRGSRGPRDAVPLRRT
jgi:2-polyprenyl-6-methoxyphenol hydroxylase-like FAD-dependent oxidoreductase